MNVTAEERRSVLGLLNISEAARQLDVPVRKMQWDITAGRLPPPRIRLGKRLYYSMDDLVILAKRCSAKQNHP